MKNIRSLIATAIILTAGQAYALDRGQTITYSGEKAESLISAVDNSVWVADGKGADRQIYVIFSPVCPFSQRLFQEFRALTDKVQFRWVPHDGPGADWVAENRSVDAVSQAFANPAKYPQNSSLAHSLLSYNQDVVRQILLLIATNGGNTISYPTLIYASSDGVRVTVGPVPNLKLLLSQVVSRPQMAAFHPTSIALASTPVPLTAIAGPSLYENNTSKSQAIRDYPTETAPVVATLEPHMTVPARAVTADGWVAVQPFHSGQDSFIYNPRFAQLSLMSFEIQPSSGTFSAANGPVRVFSHPSADADVINSLPQGYNAQITGRVKGQPWYQIQVFTDGTKGYVLDQ